MEKMSVERLSYELDSLRYAVADMRHHQREYFRTRSHGALQQAKRAEKKVDELLAPRTQVELF